jgi:chemotaxis protein MotA
MLVIVGYIILMASVLGGYVAAGGHLHALVQPFELLIISGAAFGAFIVTNTGKVTKATFKLLPTVFQGSKFTKERYLSLLGLMYEVLSKIRKEGLMSIEKDVETPESSTLFGKYPAILADHHLVEFITDYLRMMVSGNLNPMEIESLMDQELETHHQEGHVLAHAVQQVADGLPAFGIVAAVMGVVHVMGSVGAPPAVLGEMIGGALVGTFVGILLAYGFVGPLAVLLGQKLDEASKQFICVKVTLLASMNGYAPQVAVEFGRKVLYSTERPSFSELEQHVKQSKGK